MINHKYRQQEIIMVMEEELCQIVIVFFGWGWGGGGDISYLTVCQICVTMTCIKKIYKTAKQQKSKV